MRLTVCGEALKASVREKPMSECRRHGTAVDGEILSSSKSSLACLNARGGILKE